jgi:glycosyltransferase involved in cell wall biosynthesis
MRVWVSLPDKDGCGHYRALWPGQAADSDDVRVEFIERLGMTIDEAGHVTDMDKPRCDVFVMCRPLRRLNYESIAVMQRKGIAVVVDIDDDFEALDPRHIAFKRSQPKYNRESNRVWLRKACAAADLVTCTTPALAERYGSHGRSAVLPNFIPRRMLGALSEQPRDGRTVGWPGHVGTHPRDLLATRGGVGQACREAGARFVNVGSGAEVVEQLGLGDVEYEPRGYAEFADYPHAIANFDVGIVPLDDTKFNAAKSALKGLELAAVGVPFVASPTDDYRRINEHGIGLLADWKAKKWRRAVLDLLANRDEYAEQFRAGVVDQHLLEDNAWRWIEAWDDAKKIAAKRSPVAA